MNNLTMCFFYAITPIHAGSESGLGVVDLPIQREAHTGWPHIQASAVKGAMRAHFRQNSKHKELINYIFGLDSENDGEEKKPENNEDSEKLLPGAISVSDAKLLLFPVRSNIAPFVWVTCPTKLRRLKFDLDFIDKTDLINEIPSIREEEGIFLSDYGDGIERVVLEDAVINVNKNNKYVDWFSGLSSIKNFDIKRILLISDDMYKYVVENFTEIQTQIKIDEKTGIVKEGALRYEELLPSDSLLYSVIYFGDAVNGDSLDTELKANNIKEHVKSSINKYLQIGGDATLGRGICKVFWL